MKRAAKKVSTDIAFNRLAKVVCARLGENKRVRRNLPGWGRIHIDRQLPFFCIYRLPPKRVDTGTERLAISEASYMIASGERRFQSGLSELVQAVTRTLTERYGACFVVEIWSGSIEPSNEPLTVAAMSPEFRIVVPKNTNQARFVDGFQEILTRVKVSKQPASVSMATSTRCAPLGFSPILTPTQAENIGCHFFGLEVAPIYRNPDTGDVFPLILRELRRKLTRALHAVIFDYARINTTYKSKHHQSLGRRGMVKAVWETDRILAEVSGSFDFLLQVTPVNSGTAWQKFQRSKYERIPVFHYRPTPIDPVILKRKLYKAPVERIEDPVLAHLFRQKLTELDRQITLIQERNTSRFIHESAQLYGEIDDDLYGLASRIMDRIPARSREVSGKGKMTALEFCDRAREEIALYRDQYPKINATVEIRDDVAGLMVSSGNLFINSASSIPLSRVDALIQHEIGTHVLTYHNGRAQSFQQLYTGMAGYDALQEGLAVLAEYLVGGLSRPRVRLLAARVLAARSMLDGADFLETFRLLHRDYKMNSHTAFTVALRVHRSGGLSKDAMYLRGLCQMLDYLADGGKLDILYVGKIGIEHIPIIRELLWRHVLTEPPLIPRFLDRPDVKDRLEKLRKGVSVLELAERKKK